MLEIVKHPNLILEEIMPGFDFSNPITDPKQLEKDMIETMLANRGVGLSANQVGIKTRMFVIGDSEHAVGIFNPVIVEAEDLKLDTEGCLSFPGLILNVNRPCKVKAIWQDSDGNQHQGQLEGITAKCFLHEMDHLDGITFKDRVSPLKWALSNKKLEKQKRKFNVRAR